MGRAATLTRFAVYRPFIVWASLLGLGFVAIGIVSARVWWSSRHLSA